MLTKLRYQLGGDQGYGYLQLSFRNQAIVKRRFQRLLTTYTPPGFTGGGGGDDAVPDGSSPNDLPPLGGYQSFAGTTLAAHQSNYGFDAQLPLGGEKTRRRSPVDDAPAQPYDDAQIPCSRSTGRERSHNPISTISAISWETTGSRSTTVFRSTGLLSFKYDLGTEQSRSTNYMQSQVTAEVHDGCRCTAGTFRPNDDVERCR